MMTPAESTNSIARAIQLALGPVFLLTGIAGMLNVMTGRLSRIIDRGRALTGNQYDVISSGMESDMLKLQLRRLEKRRHFTSIAITACTIAALLVCMDITALFLQEMLELQLAWLIATLFTAAILALVVGLAFFLREVHQSSQAIRISISESGNQQD
jgi:hypothetical protein